MPENKAVTRYWLDHYVSNGLCTLCGNSGFVDTRPTAVSARGAYAGRVNFCICPNGQTHREHADPMRKPLNRSDVGRPKK